MKMIDAVIASLLFIMAVAQTGNASSNTAATVPDNAPPSVQTLPVDRHQMLITKMKTEYYMSTDYDVLPEMIGDSTIGPGKFVAISNIIVSGNRTLTITPGTTIFFEPQRRLIVEGTLLAASSSNGKIVFTHTPIDMRYIKIAIADSLWGGISLEPGSKLFLNHIFINNATTGISTTDAVKQIDIACIDMSRNVTEPLISEGKSIPIENIHCVSTADLLRQVSVLPSPTPMVVVDSASSKKTIQSPPPTLFVTKKNVFNVGSGIITAGGIGAATYGLWRYFKYADRYEESTNPSLYTPGQIDRYKEKAIHGEVLGIFGSIAGILGAAGLLTVNLVF